MNRRTFFLSTGATSVAAFAASDRVNVVLVGAGGRGRDHVQDFSQIPEARIGGICDADQGRALRMAALAAKLQGATPKIYPKLEDVLRDKSVDVVTIATCNHWHALARSGHARPGRTFSSRSRPSHNIFEGCKYSRRGSQEVRTHGPGRFNRAAASRTFAERRTCSSKA